jgi:hypothetical protein
MNALKRYFTGLSCNRTAQAPAHNLPIAARAAVDDKRLLTPASILADAQSEYFALFRNHRCPRPPELPPAHD